MNKSLERAFGFAVKKNGSFYKVQDKVAQRGIICNCQKFCFQSIVADIIEAAFRIKLCGIAILAAEFTISRNCLGKPAPGAVGITEFGKKIFAQRREHVKNCIVQHSVQCSKFCQFSVSSAALCGSGVFSRKYEIPIYATPGTIAGIQAYSRLGAMPEGLYHVIHSDESFMLGDIRVNPFAISHDANEPTGYRLECRDKSVAVATDLGIYDAYTVSHLQNLDAVLLEANHDLHMLEVGPYPYPLKRRVMGDKGHLSNELSGRLLCDILHDNLKHIVLGHLSKENNYESLAYETVKLEVTLGDNAYKGEDLNMAVAKRDSISEIITV